MSSLLGQQCPPQVFSVLLEGFMIINSFTYIIVHPKCSCSPCQRINILHPLQREKTPPSIKSSVLDMTLNFISWCELLKPRVLIPLRVPSLGQIDRFKNHFYSIEIFHTVYVANSISFQTFVQAFKVDVDSWKFSMLLLYILWDDWPIFMISSSNEQLQQQLEYTLLKPDCHSWWFSKMQSGHEDTLEERYAIKFCFKLGKNAAIETYGMLQIAFGTSCMNQASVFEWHKRFKEGRQSVRDDEKCGRSKEINRPELIGQRVRVTVTMLRF